MKDIKHIYVLKSTATLRSHKAVELDDKLVSRYPDECFLQDLVDSIEERDEEKVCDRDDCGVLNDDDANFCKGCGSRLPIAERSTFAVNSLDWSGFGTGATFHSVFVKQIAPNIGGYVEAVVLLEGDEKVPPKMFGFTINDGVYTKCDLDIRLIASPTL